jgi:hypothetical protein
MYPHFRWRHTSSFVFRQVLDFWRSIDLSLAQIDFAVSNLNASFFFFFCSLYFKAERVPLFYSKDSMGNTDSEILRSGDLELTSAGTGTLRLPGQNKSFSRPLTVKKGNICDDSASFKQTGTTRGANIKISSKGGEELVDFR